jgi:hypothetical protein
MGGKRLSSADDPAIPDGEFRAARGLMRPQVSSPPCREKVDGRY